jgi:epoxyqueuosine reductase QueG
MIDDLKQNLVNRLKQAGAYDARIADPHVGFEHALPKQHPLEVWDQCRSVVVFAVACPPQGNNTYLGPYAPWQGERYIGPVPEWIQSEAHAMDRLVRLFIASITLKGMAFLSDNGCGISFHRPQHKLSAFEAGIGAYGRSGLILHPALGNRLRLGVILTDAVLEPDGRLEGFEPCESCDLCIKACPAKAFDPAKPYPHSFTRATCASKRAEIEDKELYCHNCYAVCPAGTIDDEELLRIAEAASFAGMKREA